MPLSFFTHWMDQLFWVSIIIWTHFSPSPDFLLCRFLGTFQLAQLSSSCLHALGMSLGMLSIHWFVSYFRNGRLKSAFLLGRPGAYHVPRCWVICCVRGWASSRNSASLSRHLICCCHPSAVLVPGCVIRTLWSHEYLHLTSSIRTTVMEARKDLFCCYELSNKI